VTERASGGGRPGPPYDVPLGVRGSLHGPHLGVLRRLADEGLCTVEDVLRRAEGIRDLPRRANYRLRAAGLLVHVKRGKARPFAPARRIPPEAAGIAALVSAGVPTAPLVFTGVDRRLGSVTGTLDLAPALPLDRVLRDGGLLGAPRRRLLRDLAEAVARLHDAGLHHRDLYLNHVFVEPAADRPRFAVIDCERVARHRRVLSRWVVKDLAALEVSAPPEARPAERLAFLVAYLRARGLRPRRRLRRLARRVRRKARRMRFHVPRTPVGDAAPRPAPLPPIDPR
jgi:heptose I phosphotransferase